MDLLKDLQRIKVKDSFAQDLSIVVSGRFLVVLLGLLLTPLLSRLYTPHAYGLFSFFNSFSTNMALIATLRLPLAFVVPEGKRDFRDLLQVTCGLLFGATLFFTLLFFLFGGPLFRFFDVEEFVGWEALFGVSCFVYAAPLVLGNWNVRKKAFRRTTPIGVLSNLNIKAFSLIYGYLQKGFYFGLIYGELWGKLIRLFSLSFLLWKELPLIWRGFSFAKFGKVLRRYRNYPAFILPSSWIELFIKQLPIFFLILLYAPEAAGAYTMVAALLSIPLRILGDATMPVVLQRSSRLRNEASKRELGGLLENLAGRLLLLPFISFPVLIFWGDPILTWFLGGAWGQAGSMVAFVGVMYLLRAPLDSFKQVLNLFNMERYQFKMNLLRLLVGVLAFSVAYPIFPEAPELSLFSFASSMFLIDLLYLQRIFRELEKGFMKLFVMFLGLMTLSFLLCFGIDRFILP